MQIISYDHFVVYQIFRNSRENSFNLIVSMPFPNIAKKSPSTDAIDKMHPVGSVPTKKIHSIGDVLAGDMLCTHNCCQAHSKP